MSPVNERMDLSAIRSLLEAGDVVHARALLEQGLPNIRRAFQVAARELVEQLLLYEAIHSDNRIEKEYEDRGGIDLCEEASRISSIANLPDLEVRALTRAATRYAAQGNSAAHLKALRRAVEVAEANQLDSEYLRETVVLAMLSADDVKAASVEVESWPFWGTGPVSMWLIAEALFRGERRECLPLLERMLQDQSEWDEASLAELERMRGIAQSWPS